MNVKTIAGGMGQAVAERTILRKIDGVLETWADVAHRVAVGNTSLVKDCPDFEGFKNHLLSATILMSGRHLQHGDETQNTRNLEVFSNCSSAATSFLLFYLLLNGAGVGRCYDDDMMLVNWDNAPTVRCVIDENHADYDYSAHESARDAKHKYGQGDNVHWFKVPDSREGWGQAMEMYETMAFQKAYRDELLVLDFSDVRPKNAPIAGMQNRPSSGPVPLMNAIHKMATLKGAGLPRWLQAMYIDHFAAEPVLVGGARRAARAALKIWTDKSVLDFIRIKRPIEYNGLSMEQVIKYRRDHPFAPQSFLWSSNNSVMVDVDFWRRLAITPDQEGYNSDLTRHAREVHRLVTECSYGDGNGEPGYLNVDMLTNSDEGKENLLDGNFVGSRRYKISDQTKIYLAGLAKRAAGKKYGTIVNPCFEVPFNLLGAYCVIGSAIPYHADTLQEAEDAFKHIARSLIRVNTMDNIYGKETKRTNRIAVGQLGVHEFAWKFFQVGFKDLINPDFAAYREVAASYTPFVDPYQIIKDLATYKDAGIRAAAFWECQGQFSRATVREAYAYSDELGVKRPHTCTMIAPNGTIAKLFLLSEGWHLPSMAEFMRWVQFRHDDPLVEQYRAAGYQTRDLKTYEGTTIVGFPTAPAITQLGMGDALVLAGDASPIDQYKWVQLGEFFWIEGGSVSDYLDHQTPRPGEKPYGGQISYTLKFKPEDTKFPKFLKMLTEGQPSVRACCVMPQTSNDNSSYEYQPEEPVSKEVFDAAVAAIAKAMDEDVGREHVDCSTGACPIVFHEGNKE